MKQSLNGSWTLLNACSGESMQATVPGSIMNAYLEAGLAADPFYRDNEYKAYELFRDDFIYSRTFYAKTSLTGKDSLELVCEGIDTLGEITLNGRMIASCDNMHRTYRIGIKGILREGVNDISVRIKSPVEYIEKAWREKGPVWGVCARDGYQFIRKAHYMFGWDWGPAIADGGIWRDIYIEAHDFASIADVYVSQVHSAGKVVLEVRPAIRKYTECDASVIVNVYGPDGTLCNSGNCPADGKVSMEIPKPRLWWPAGHGAQPLYVVEARLLADGCETDVKSYETGLRTLKIAREDDGWGQSFAFEINGVRIFAKGANYIPEDSILARCSPERTKNLVMHAVSANFNTLRVWGGGIYPPDCFFETCDRLGIIVWQDFMFACAQYVLDDPGFVDSIRAEIRDNIRRLRHHASIALWCGNNEMEWLWVDSQTEGRSQGQKDEYLRLFEGIIPGIAKAEDP
ncbi:MAG: glycoside hydrolase family 2 protein, partial [Clostridia bacterium]|nr:glycoside hydrolase family 2 protein [Clostridia bacterium]